LRQAVERALEPRPHTPSALRDAVRKRAPSPRGDLDRAIAAAFPTDERGRVAETLQRAITRKYRAQEFGFYEELINRPTITQGETIFVTMPIWFETASGPWSDAPGEDMTWVGREYRVNESKFWRYRRLVRQPFVARGKLTFEPVGIPGRPPRPAEITLRVYGLTASDERRQTT
jgi:hypothetical protein